MAEATGSRPRKLVVVLGTGTGVGKTWVAATTLRSLRSRGIPAVARKPVQSADPDDPTPTDSAILAVAAGEEAHEVCPPHRCYELAMAPPMAAEELGRAPFTVTDLVRETLWPPGTLVGLVETVGGPRSPATHDGDSLALAAGYRPDMALLVSGAGLGAINAVRLSMAAVAELGVPTVVVLNRFRASDPVHQSNRSQLERDGFTTAFDIPEMAKFLSRSFPCEPR